MEGLPEDCTVVAVAVTVAVPEGDGVGDRVTVAEGTAGVLTGTAAGVIVVTFWV
jgi:hypothetical protein